LSGVVELPSARPLSDGEGTVARDRTLVLGVALADVRADADGATLCDVVARTVARAVCDCRGAEDDLLVVGGCPDPTTTVPVMFVWIAQRNAKVPTLGKPTETLGALPICGFLGRSFAPDHGQVALESCWTHSTGCSYSVSRFSQVTVPPGSMDTLVGVQPLEMPFV